jgi:hypothetical protein
LIGGEAEHWGSELPPRSSIRGAAELARTTSCFCAWPDGDLELRLPGSTVARALCQHGGMPRGLRGGGGPTLARRLHLELGQILWRWRGEARLPPPQAWPSAPPTSLGSPRPRIISLVFFLFPLPPPQAWPRRIHHYYHSRPDLTPPLT